MKGLREKRIMTTAFVMCFMAVLPVPVFASSIAEGIVRYGLNELFWVVIAAGIGMSAFTILKRAYVATIGVLIGAAVLAYLCKNPQTLGNWADRIGSSLGFIGL